MHDEETVSTTPVGFVHVEAYEEVQREQGNLLWVRTQVEVMMASWAFAVPDSPQKTLASERQFCGLHDAGCVAGVGKGDGCYPQLAVDATLHFEESADGKSVGRHKDRSMGLFGS